LSENRAAISFLGKLIDTRSADAGERHLGRNEEGVKYDQNWNPENLKNKYSHIRTADACSFGYQPPNPHKWKTGCVLCTGRNFEGLKVSK
jgi:hypothetical protein